MRRHISRIGCGARGSADVAAPCEAEPLHADTSHSMSNGSASRSPRPPTVCQHRHHIQLFNFRCEAVEVMLSRRAASTRGGSDVATGQDLMSTRWCLRSGCCSSRRHTGRPAWLRRCVRVHESRREASSWQNGLSMRVLTQQQSPHTDTNASHQPHHGHPRYTNH